MGTHPEALTTLAAASTVVTAAGVLLAARPWQARHGAGTSAPTIPTRMRCAQAGLVAVFGALGAAGPALTLALTRGRPTTPTTASVFVVFALGLGMAGGVWAWAHRLDAGRSRRVPSPAARARPAVSRARLDPLALALAGADPDGPDPGRAPEAATGPDRTPLWSIAAVSGPARRRTSRRRTGDRGTRRPDLRRCLRRRGPARGRGSGVPPRVRTGRTRRRR